MMEKSAASSRPCTTTKRVAKKRLALKAIAKLESAGRVANPGTPGVRKAG